MNGRGSQADQAPHAPEEGTPPIPPGGRLHDLLGASSLRAVQNGDLPGLLLLDYDGTLAPFVADRDHALPYPGVRDCLKRLATEGAGRYVIITGRDATEIGPLLGLEPLPEIWGCHGAQRLLTTGERREAPLSPAHSRAYREARRIAQEEGITPGALEGKTCSLALHTRGMDATSEERARLARAQWARLAGQNGLDLRLFDGGFELRVPGLDKGGAIRLLAAENPGHVLTFLGDDMTDEDAFAAVAASKRPGLAVLVRDHWRPGAAEYWIRPPAQLLAFLRAWPGATVVKATHRR